MIIIVLYADDLILTGSSTSQVKELKLRLHELFSLTEIALLHYFLGIQITQSTSGISFSKPKCVLDFLQRFKMEDCKPVSTPLAIGMKSQAYCSSPSRSSISPQLDRACLCIHF